VYTLEGAEWNNVTIPANVTLKDTAFLIPAWKGLNTWSGASASLNGVSISKRYVDDEGTPTVEKLWYETTDVNGVTTYTELT
jgi:hypothetical protein